jgi:acetylornithine aminotransferase
MKTFPFPGHAMLLPEIVRADNCSLFDAAGNRYVDLESGVWCTPAGHGNPAVKAAISGQLDSVAHVGFCYGSSVVEEAAGGVQELLGHDGGRCAFLCSGSEAVEYGMRVMRAVLDGARVMTMADSYFGAYGDAASRRDGWFVFDWFGCEECGREACTADCPRWASIPFDEIGGFLFEPGSSSGFVRFPPAMLIESIGRALKEKGGLFMVNEVTTGMGRTGRWFGHQHYDVRPDIAALGKGVGNGYPVSVSSLNADVVSRLGGKPIPYGQSHLNDPLGAAVVRAVIGEFEEKRLLERAAGLSDILLPGLRAIAETSPRTVTVRGRGLMAAVELGMDPADAASLHESLVRSGFICALRPGSDVLRIDPALTIDEGDLRGFIDTLGSLLA